ncbi:MAG: glycoside hydrolase family 32 protein [Caulobacterales bacterium]|nr:glycoside hydrolase family 32 protein [Caulobacterales bacterium]
MTPPITPSTTARSGEAPQFASTVGWVNDPNGLVYLDGEYHLFYQHNPGERTWGPMHWGHAVSRDLMTWDELDVALSPDELGWIFSGSVIADIENRARLSRAGETVLIAFFTHHDRSAKLAGRRGFEHQSMAVSHDKGRNWTKYSGNPVLPNPGDAADFRDPCVFWHAATGAWIMVLSAGDRAQFYRSTNLVDWSWASDFTAGRGAALGVWECPHVCEVPIEGELERRWMLVQSVNPGGRLGGSGTRYYIGRFDGYGFAVDGDFQAVMSAQGDQWLDWGPDNYASISWANLPAGRDRPLVIGWMSNWAYAHASIERPFRGRMTTPRELSVVRTAAGLGLRTRSALPRARIADLPIDAPSLADRPSLSVIELKARPAPADRPRLTLESAGADVIAITFDPDTNTLSVDRRAAHPTGDPSGLAGQFAIPRQSASPELRLTVYVSPFALEMFIDDGLQAATALLDSSLPVDRARLHEFERVHPSSAA